MNFIKLFFSAGRLWLRSEADQYAGALAYFVPFALTPLISVSIIIVGLLIGTEGLLTLLKSWAGAIDPGLPALFSTSLNSLSILSQEYPVPIVAIFFFSFMAIFALNSITAGLHKLWGIERVGWQAFLYRYLRAGLFIALLQIYFVFIILLNSSIKWLVTITDLPQIGLLNPVLFISSTILLFAVGYGVLPLSAPPFKARLIGATVAGILFYGLQIIVNIYFATSPVISVYGTASLVFVMLVWFYIGASIIFYGAAFTKVYQDTQIKITN